MIDVKGISPYPLVQICWAVDDIETAARRWAETTGAGPFYVSAHIEYADLIYRGRPATFDQSSAFGQSGDMQIELLQQHCDSPSGVREMFRPGETGIQHLTWFAPDLDAEIARMNGLGFDTVMTCSVPVMQGMCLAWFDTRPLLGAMAEVYEDRELMHRFYARIRKAAEGWDGSDVVRML